MIHASVIVPCAQARTEQVMAMEALPQIGHRFQVGRITYGVTRIVWSPVQTVGGDTFMRPTIHLDF